MEVVFVPYPAAQVMRYLSSAVLNSLICLASLQYLENDFLHRKCTHAEGEESVF